MLQSSGSFGSIWEFLINVKRCKHWINCKNIKSDPQSVLCIFPRLHWRLLRYRKNEKFSNMNTFWMRYASTDPRKLFVTLTKIIVYHNSHYIKKVLFVPTLRSALNWLKIYLKIELEFNFENLQYFPMMEMLRFWKYYLKILLDNIIKASTMSMLYQQSK